MPHSRTRQTLFFGLIAATIFSETALAQSATNNFYLGVDALVAGHSAKWELGEVTENPSTGTPFKVTGGYHLSPNVSIEASYYTIKAGKTYPDEGIIYQEVQVLPITAVFTQPLTSNISLQGKAGVAFTQARLDLFFLKSGERQGDNTTAAKFTLGGALAYQITPQFSAVAGFDWLPAYEAAIPTLESAKFTLTPNNAYLGMRFAF